MYWAIGLPELLRETIPGRGERVEIVELDDAVNLGLPRLIKPHHLLLQ